MPKTIAKQPGASRVRAAKPTTAMPAYPLPALKKGEHYAGVLLQAGKPVHHLILLPGEKAEVAWTAAQAWAKQRGGELPTRREQALLFANAKEHFQERYYWSGEQLADNGDYAWYQHFGDGLQDYGHKDGSLRARAVRRLVIR